MARDVQQFAGKDSNFATRERWAHGHSLLSHPRFFSQVREQSRSPPSLYCAVYVTDGCNATVVLVASLCRMIAAVVLHSEGVCTSLVHSRSCTCLIQQDYAVHA
jgi:hypothetical protein